MLAALLVIVLILGGLITSQHNRRWVIPYYTAMFFKVRPFETESVMFYEAGMPETGLSLRDEEFYDWFLARGQSTYQRWVITRLGSYTEAWEQLVKDGESEALDKEYFRRLARYPSPSIAQPALFLFEMSAPPQAVWICILLLPALDWLRNRRLGLLSLWTASLVLATYVQVFFGYHGAGVETVRHTLTGSILYRITFLVGLYTAFSILRTGRRRGGGG